MNNTQGLYRWVVTVEAKPSLDDAELERLHDALESQPSYIEDTLKMVTEQRIQDAARLAGITQQITVKTQDQ